jgi:tetratricopeptide (TPR) repeat protein
LHPDHEIYGHRAQAYYSIKEYDKALADLNKSIELNSEYSEAYYYRGLCYKALGQADKAITDFQSASNYSDDDAMKKQAMDEIKGMR